jgi:hypothetical protein
MIVMIAETGLACVKRPHAKMVSRAVWILTPLADHSPRALDASENRPPTRSTESVVDSASDSGYIHRSLHSRDLAGGAL